MSDFNKNRAKKDGLQYCCKVCAKNAAYYRENSDKISTQQAAYKKANPEKIAALNAAYRQNNPEKFMHLPIRYWVSLIVRPLILNRDNNVCQICGVNKNLVIHHILPVKNILEQEHVSKARNLITLCKKCHLHTAHSGNFKTLDMALAHKLMALIKAKEVVNPTILPPYEP